MGDAAPPPTSFSVPAPEQLPAKKRQRGNLRTKRATEEEEDAPLASTSTSGAGAEGEGVQGPGSRGASAEEVQRHKLEELRLLHRMRRRLGGTDEATLMRGARDELHHPTIHAAAAPSDAEHEDGHELLGTFSKAETVATTDEDPNMQSFIEVELAKRLGKQGGAGGSGGGAAAVEGAEARRKRMEAELYQIPQDMQTDLSNSDVVIPGMNVIITEVPTSADVRMHNIEETEAMKRCMLGGAPDRDAKADAKALLIKRNQAPLAFGRSTKQPRDPDFDREKAAEEAKRMRFVTERRPALSTHKQQRQQKTNSKF